MTMLASEVFRCWNCRQKSEHTVMLTSNMLCEPDLDSRPGEDYRSTMSMWVQECPYCRYCAFDISKKSGDAKCLKSQRYRDALARNDLPDLARKFLAMAICYESSDYAKTASLLLYGAWICDDNNLAWQALDFRRQAASWYFKLKPYPTNAEGFGTAAILVDILRRVGRFEEAESECRSLLNSELCPDRIRRILYFQIELIGHCDTNCHQEPESKF